MEKNLKKNRYMCTTESLCYMPELTQHCKSTILQLRKSEIKQASPEFLPTLAYTASKRKTELSTVGQDMGLHASYFIINF